MTRSLTAEHLACIRDHYDGRGGVLTRAARSYRRILARYYRLLIPADASVLEVGCGAGTLLAALPNRDVTGIDLSGTQIARARDAVPHGVFHCQAGEEIDLDRRFDYIIVSDTINEAADVQTMFTALRRHAGPRTRLVLNFYNSLWRPVLGLARLLRLAAKRPECSWLAPADVANLLELAGWETVRSQPRILLPVRCLGLERLVNAYLAPLLPFLCLSVFSVARPRPDPTERRERTVSVVIPARNEAGNIEDAIRRTPPMGAGTEFIFIEGNSSDDTWEAIQRVKHAHPELDIKIMQQSGKGKGNAVREAFAAASGDILMILDADLTMPPEELPKYYEAVASGQAEFANGVRLVYPMAEEAMRFFNMCANKAFSLVFTYLLGEPIKDTLCGTKVLCRHDYEQIAANRAYFGDFDPFGDFDLIFGAAKLNLKMVDIPIRYRERTYGTTNIARWRNGVILLRMVLFAARKLKFV